MRVKRVIQPREVSDQTKIDETLMEPLLQKYKHKKGSLIPILQGVQQLYGYLPHAAFHRIHKELGIELSDMFGVATFYTQFRLQPAGKHIIKVCHGTACHVQNADSITEALRDALSIQDGETTEDGLFTLEAVACLGCCSLAPVMMIGDHTYGKLTGKEAVKIIKDYKLKEQN
ncbi:MAG: NADH-quinone oxidoreductase subunit NuoE [Bacteroidales bacterium]|jgi:NADH-quinone oxidoreductase subunit E